LPALVSLVKMDAHGSIFSYEISTIRLDFLRMAYCRLSNG